MQNPLFRIAVLVNISLSLLVAGLGCERHFPNEPRLAIDLTNLGQRGQTVVFSEIRDVSQLPGDVTTQLAGGFANPGDRFRETDVSDSSLPLRRLVVAGVSDRYVLVDYEKGGISKYFVAALFLRSNQEAKLVSVSGSPRGSKLSEIKAQIESGELKNELGRLIY